MREVFRGREARAQVSYLASVGGKWEEHGHLILWDGCFHSEYVFDSNTEIINKFGTV